MRRFFVALLWLAGISSVLGGIFVVSFYLAVQRKQRSTEVEVPDLVGTTPEDARAAAAPLGLVIQVVDQRHDPRVASGRILQQMPASGAAVRRGRKVKVVLSLGGLVIAVPDVLGQPGRTVPARLAREGLQPGEEAHAHSYVVPSGVVLAQVPPPGSLAVPGARVHRLVSLGPPPARWVMPDLTGRRRPEAEQWLAQHGLRRGVVRQTRSSRWPAGVVAGHEPLPGHPVRTRDIVELTVAE